jgi:hypothetical protein
MHIIDMGGLALHHTWDVGEDSIKSRFWTSLSKLSDNHEVYSQQLVGW